MLTALTLSGAGWRRQNTTGNDPSRGLRETTYFHINPTLYPFLPHRDQGKRAGRRVALLRRQSSAESVISSLELSGVTLSGQAKPKWVTTPRRAEWLGGMALAGQTFKRLAHVSGAYELAERAARVGGVLK